MIPVEKRGSYGMDDAEKKTLKFDHGFYGTN